MPKITPQTVNKIKKAASHVKELLTQATPSFKQSKAFLSKSATKHAMDVRAQINMDSIAKARLVGSIQVSGNSVDKIALDMHLTSNMMTQNIIPTVKRHAIKPLHDMNVLNRMLTNNLRSTGFNKYAGRVLDSITHRSPYKSSPHGVL